ncbi:putative NBD/HSP70 family sugar kinase [Hamadaea flava]|uniref:ROK family protein n=1 Tax=Hamadaea flava TaxID=1742688 RepID=A0ABV8LXQ4_9ACTN|nr:ROK family transcriptional regulator [Hamadaea flava]MCP2329297.1 putative NBD/HSP70 family sugar kinase [Hamadaea flava]
MPTRRFTTVHDLRRNHRAELLSALYVDGPLTRPELSAATGLSAGTVSNVINDLIEAGAVVEAGALDSSGGRPRILLRVNPTRGYAIGVSIGPRHIQAGVFDLAMTELSRIDQPLPPEARDPEQAARRIEAVTDEVIRTAGVDRAQVLGLGVGVSGVVEHGDEILVSAETMGWNAVPLARLLQHGRGIPLFVDNGAKNMGQAELWFGAGRGAQEAVIALLSSGVGAAIVTHGSVYQGASSSAGEWGHMTVEVGGRRCGCGARGCLEAYIGAEAIIDRYRQLTGRRTDPYADDQAVLADIVAAAPDDPDAQRVIDETALYLGTGVANLINLINPERIIIGGWAGLLLGDRILPAVREITRENALRVPFNDATIHLAKLGVDAAIVGAAALPIAEFLRTGGAAAQTRVEVVVVGG